MASTHLALSGFSELERHLTNPPRCTLGDETSCASLLSVGSLGLLLLLDVQAFGVLADDNQVDGRLITSLGCNLDLNIRKKELRNDIGLRTPTTGRMLA